LTGFDLNLDVVTYYGPGGATSAVSDFSETAVLNGLDVFENSNGTNPAPNPTFTSADGKRSAEWWLRRSSRFPTCPMVEDKRNVILCRIVKYQGLVAFTLS
jgi:hypothetical protein